MHSCLYEGTVRHRRWLPVLHAFRYRLFLVYLDLAEIDDLFGKHGVWSARWPAIARFRRADHLGEPARPLDESVRDLVRSHIGWRPNGPIRLLTNFRYFGCGMNPISLFYCLDARGERVEAIVAEVTNTPWNEQHCYVLDFRSQAAERPLKAECSKEFHVSPFMAMDMNYRWRLTLPGRRLKVRIENHAQGRSWFDADLTLRRTLITRGQLARVLMQYPLQTVRIFAGIYWQALRLRLKSLPVVPHPNASSAAAVSRQATTAHPATDHSAIRPSAKQEVLQ